MFPDAWTSAGLQQETVKEHRLARAADHRGGVEDRRHYDRPRRAKEFLLYGDDLDPIALEALGQELWDAGTPLPGKRRGR